jgi:hypothetical protein
MDLGLYPDAYNAFKTAIGFRENWNSQVSTLIGLVAVTKKLGRTKESQSWTQTALVLDQMTPDMTKKQITTDPECEMRTKDED